MRKASFLLLFAFSATAVFAQTNPGITPPSNRAQIYYLYTNARLLESGGQFERGIEELKKALVLDSNSSFLFSSIADMYLRNRRAQEASEFAEKAVLADPDNADPHRLLSRIYFEIYTTAVRRPNQQDRSAATAALNRAIHEFEEIVRIDPMDQASFLNLGRLYEAQGNPQKAEEIYRKLLGGQPDSEQAVRALAQLQLDSGDFSGAVATLEKFLKSSPDSEEAWQMLGDTYSGADKFDKAADAYKHAAELVPDDADVQKAYAQALFLDTQYEEAGKIYQKLYIQDPSDLAPLVLMSEVYRHQMKFDLARAILQRAAQLSPDPSQFDMNLALLDRDEGKLDDSLKRLTEIARRTERRNGNYNDAERQSRRRLLTQIALLQSTMGRYDDAIKSFTDLRVLSANDRGRVDSFIVSTYRESRNLDKALEYAETSLKESPNSRALAIMRADVIADKGRVTEAVQALERLATPGVGDDLEIASAIVGIYERAKKFTDAQKILDAASKKFPDDLQVHFLQGALHEKQDRIADAEASFRKALELEKNSAPAMNYLGYMLADRGLKLDEALKLIQKAVEVDPGNGAYLDSLGWVYFRMNRLDLAEEFLKKAARFVDNDADIHDHLGELHYKRGNYDGARQEWSKALTLSTDNDDIQRFQKKLDELKTKVAEK